MEKLARIFGGQMLTGPDSTEAQHPLEIRTLCPNTAMEQINWRNILLYKTTTSFAQDRDSFRAQAITETTYGSAKRKLKRFDGEPPRTPAYGGDPTSLHQTVHILKILDRTIPAKITREKRSRWASYSPSPRSEAAPPLPRGDRPIFLIDGEIFSCRSCELAAACGGSLAGF
jgi:hypothetical protein